MQQTRRFLSYYKFLLHLHRFEVYRLYLQKFVIISLANCRVTIEQQFRIDRNRLFYAFFVILLIFQLDIETKSLMILGTFFKYAQVKGI